MSLTYDLKAVDLMIGGFRMSGAGEAGLVEYEWASDLAELTVGADGEAIVSALNNNALIATVTLMESSVSYATLAANMEVARLLSGIAPLPANPFFMFDRRNGDSVSGTARFLTRPTPSKLATVGEREFRIVLPKAIVLYGTLNVVPF